METAESWGYIVFRVQALGFRVSGFRVWGQVIYIYIHIYTSSFRQLLEC